MTTKEKKRWRKLSGCQRAKKLWFGVSFVNFVGPIAYFAFGRRG